MIEKQLVINDVFITEYSLDEKKEIQVPVVMMVEGVHNGNKGPLLWEAEVLKRQVDSWKGVPVTIGHPAKDGEYVSANSEGVVSVGVISEVFFEEKKLRAIITLKKELLSPETLQLLNGGRLEVSIGAYVEEEEQEGEWSGEGYKGKVVSYVPDHLALLPGQQGACSWDDGCGIRVNENNSNNFLNLNETKMINYEKLRKELTVQGIVTFLLTNAQGFREIISSIQNKLNTLDNPETFHYLVEIYDTYFIYEVNVRNHPVRLYKRNYLIGEDATGVEFIGEPVEVRREVKYVTLRELGNLNNVNNIKKERTTMNKVNVCLESKVDVLIRHPLSNFDETDRDFLLQQTEEFLEKITPKVPESMPGVQINLEKVNEFLKQEFKKPKDYLQLLPVDFAKEIQDGLVLQTEYKKRLVEGVMTNSKSWVETELNEMPLSMLKKVHDSINVSSVNYVFAGGRNEKSIQEEEQLLPINV